MKYTVVYPFADLHDKKYKYETGDLFPRQGLEVSEDRIKELAGTDNKIGVPLIKGLPEESDPKPKEEKETKKKNSKRKNKDADRTVQRTE